MLDDPYFVRPTIPARYVEEILARTPDRERILARAAIPAGARISVEQFERLHRELRRAGDEMFGYLASPVPSGAYAALMHLLAPGPRVRDMFESAARFYGIFDRHRYWNLEREGKVATLSLSFRTSWQARSIFFVHSMLLTPWRTAAWIAGAPIALSSIRLDPRFEAYRAESAFLFGREPELARGAAEIRFDARWLDAPSVRTAADADAYVRTALRSMLSAPAGDTLEARVRAVLAAERPIASGSFESVARALGLSRATFARHLAARGLAFLEIKDDLRRDHAIALLGHAPIARVAEELGFSEPSSFARAFKAWTGVPPGRYRRRRQGA